MRFVSSWRQLADFPPSMFINNNSNLLSSISMPTNNNNNFFLPLMIVPTAQKMCLVQSKPTWMNDYQKEEQQFNFQSHSPNSTTLNFFLHHQQQSSSTSQGLFVEKQQNNYPMVIYQQWQNQQPKPFIINNHDNVITSTSASLAFPIAPFEMKGRIMEEYTKRDKQLQQVGQNANSKEEVVSKFDEGFCQDDGKHDDDVIEGQFDSMPKLEPEIVELGRENDIGSGMFRMEKITVEVDANNSIQHNQQYHPKFGIENFQTTDIEADDDGDENALHSMPNLDLENRFTMQQTSYPKLQQTTCCVTTTLSNDILSSRLAAPSVSILPPLPPQLTLCQQQHIKNKNILKHENTKYKQQKLQQRTRKRRRRLPMRKTKRIIKKSNYRTTAKNVERRKTKMVEKNKANEEHENLNDLEDNVLLIRKKMRKAAEETENRPPLYKKQRKTATINNKNNRNGCNEKKTPLDCSNCLNAYWNKDSTSTYLSLPSASSTTTKIQCLVQAQSLRLNSNWRPIGRGIYCRLPKTDSNDEPRLCFDAIRHHKVAGICVRVGDCVHVNSAEAEDDIFVGRVICIYYEPKKCSILLKLLWFYTTSQLPLRPSDLHLLHQRELFASRHLDTVNADSVQNVVHVLTFSEYCRYHTQLAIDHMPKERKPPESVRPWSRDEKNYHRKDFLPQINTIKDKDMVFFCRGIYSIRTRRVNTLGLPKKCSSLYYCRKG